MEDILFDESGKIVGVGDSVRKHQEDILLLKKGWNKFSPELGVGLMDYLDSEGEADAIKEAITYEFERDGMRINEIVFDPSGKININANY